MKVKCPHCGIGLICDEEGMEIITCAGCGLDFDIPPTLPEIKVPTKATIVKEEKIKVPPKMTVVTDEESETRDVIPHLFKEDKLPQKVDLSIIYIISVMILIGIAFLLLENGYYLGWVLFGSILGTLVFLIIMIELLLNVRWAAESLADINRRLNAKNLEKTKE
jgi:hypothetical protein